MALFHLSVTQTKRSAGQSAIASAAYRAGERLYSEYYGEYSDYTRKGGVICSDILLPSHAPPEYADRQTLWNAVEKAERGKNAQLAYSFDIALQNEFSLEENIALARQFLLENFVSRGMVVDFAVHQPDREDGGIPNPHFHVLCPIRPIEQNGKWGLKQRRVYELDEDGNRIRDANGKFVLWAGVALMLLSVLLTLFTSMANDGSVWDFAYLTEQVIKNNMSMIFPMCISLIAGYMISREQTDDTLKNILTVPISFKKLLTGKLIVCGVLSIIFGLICSLFTIIAEMIVGFPGFEISLALKAALQITAVNFFLYLAVLPIIALTCRRAGSFLVGVIIAFVYGYGGMFAAGNMTLANLYPITASLGMVGYRSYDTAVNWNIGTCSCSLALAVVISAILILCMKEREATQTKKKAKKVAPKKGW
ncbi:hypothetical protein C4885_13085 [Subdoligranulum sp. APC924/74]|nr:hypothetical protein C4885_13085 [Subdoligranulum sp. APC924/74]